ncbi:7-methylguanosine phosphate-specific 5'-nucleotidase-like [Trichogramma pretiosum]|uniref:7-methylguanosine phosphate-specific 5'-nucleotidase-like n=1 Tax=Trichogramma pretiosum TaxID=7493 RepID=UPI0006C965F0|nr:7-methylguanosine phosphate-specific 5'-nucleotidase-like [Trichogramma pretiosum]
MKRIIMNKFFSKFAATKEFKIDSIADSLLSSKVHLKDEATVFEKINKIITDGPERLQVITDFDFTITKQHEEGQPMHSSFCIFKKSKQLPSSYLEQSRVLFEKYRPIELDPRVPRELKARLLDTWMTSAHRNLKGIRFSRGEMEGLAEQHGNGFRERTKELFERLHAKQVPILILSAGLGDVVEALLRRQGILYDNIHIVSNFLKYNDGDVLDGFKRPDKVLHVLNKNGHAVDEEYFEVLKNKTNVLLMGDSLGDADMAEGAKNADNILKIGFLYHHVEENLPLYKETFDIVLHDDQTMNVVLDILSPII